MPEATEVHRPLHQVETDMNKKSIIGIAAVAAIVASASVMAVVTVNPDGTGFIGKGDVQLVYGWNNKDLQNKAGSVEFRVNSVSESTWTCTKVNELGNGNVNEIVQQRAQSTSTQGLLDEVAREKSRGKDGPVTGFNLLGFVGGVTETTDGPALESCPATQSGFVYDGNLETTSVGGGVEVNSVDGGWYPIG
jgi:hypothetical protein